MNIKFSCSWKTVGLALVALVVIVGGISWGASSYMSRPSFCGTSCHTMDEQWNAWKNNKHFALKDSEHKQATCMQCHFAPGEENSLKAKFIGLRHMAAYLVDPKAPIPVGAKIADAACLRSGCHSKEKILDKEINYTDKIRFKHRPHFEKPIEGQEIRCDSCHVKRSLDKHFETPKETCFLCHFKLGKPIDAKAQPVKLKLNEGRNKCSLCHTVPTKSLQRQLEVGADPNKIPITHQTMEQSKVSCESCHFEIIKGTGDVRPEGCLSCHNQTAELLTKVNEKKLMHEKHVGPQRADCFDCHTTIEHKKPVDYLEPERTACTLCHEDQHRYQKLLLAGAPVSKGPSGPPQFMAAVNANCMACHQKTKSIRGHSVKTATGEPCVGCHTPEHANMLKDWKSLFVKEIEAAEKVEEETLQALNKVKDGFDADKARAVFAEGQELLNVVRIGNGVHNKKYSIMILDEAIGKFEDVAGLIR